MRILLTEASSLTARETMTVLGPSGADIHLMGAGGHWPICRYSRWSQAVHHAPASTSPTGYLTALRQTVARQNIDVVLPTGDQAWLLAAHPEPIAADLPILCPPTNALVRVRGTSAFARTCQELRLPHPPSARVHTIDDLDAVGFPCWLRLEHATATSGTWLARTLDEARATYHLLVSALAEGGHLDLTVQAPTPGRYAQAAGLFDRGRLIALHCSAPLGHGIGGGAGARISVVHSDAANGLMRLGEALRWSGGLTVDYLHDNGRPQFIGCLPYTVEPGNAAAAGVDFPQLTIALTRGMRVPAKPVFASPGIRTRSTLALMAGTAEVTGARRKVAATAVGALLRRGRARASTEILTPVLRDRSSLLPAVGLGLGLLVRPALSARFFPDADLPADSLQPRAVA